MTPQSLVETYFTKNYRCVFWPQIGDTKGPRESGWPTKQYTLADYREGYRVGLLLGTEVAPGRFLHDIDIDWAPGIMVAQKLIPPTGFIFGRPSKQVSHCFYLTDEALPSYRYEDIDKTCLLELRGTKTNGEVGLQTMVPPSIWSKENKQEPLAFIRQGEPEFVPSKVLTQTACLAAIGMLLAKHLGANGFGHDVRLAWSGWLLRLGIPAPDLVAMGEGMSIYCNNLEMHDVRETVEGTVMRMLDPKQKIAGAPIFARFLGSKGLAVVARVNEWLGRDSDYLRDKDGAIVKDSQENIKRALTVFEVELTHDAFAEKLFLTPSGARPKLLVDAEVNSLWLRIDRELRFRPSFVFFEKVVMNLAMDASYHPVRRYLAGLTWDGTPRIDHWLRRYGGSPDSEYHRHVSAIVLIAAVRRVLHPGSKYDEMLVLESEQGLNKSSALRALCPVDEWFSDDLPLNVDAKQIIERTLGKWIIEASDLTGGRKADRDHLKSMLSRQVDGPARMAYAHYPVERARQFIIIGTTNSAAYLMDSTGARRFWPVAVRRFDVAGIIRDRDQLWAEAAQRESEGHSIRLPEHLWAVAGEHQEGRREIDAWEDVIEDAVSQVQPYASTGRKQIAASVIWELLGVDASHRDRLGGMRISDIMQRLGFTRHKMWVDGKAQWGFIKESGMLGLEFEDKKE